MSPGIGRFLVRTATLLFVLVGTWMLTSCGQSTPTAARGMLVGTVQAGPTCPVERADQTCPPTPVADRQVNI